MLSSAARTSAKSLAAVWLGYPLVMAGLAAAQRALASKSVATSQPTTSDGRADHELILEQSDSLA